jgi:hypothetical protein
MKGRKRRFLGQARKQSKITETRKESRQGNGKYTGKTEGNGSGNKIVNKGAAQRENQQRNKTTKRKEFKNKEKKCDEEKNSMSERVGRLERKMKNEDRRRGKNNIVITGCRGEGKSKQQIKEDIEKFIKENIEGAKVKDCFIYEIATT